MITDRWAHVKSIFGAALDLPEEQRPGFVLQACSGDLEMHAEVLTLLAANQSMGSFLDEPLTQELSFLAGNEVQSSLNPGEILCDRFEIVRLLGEGGMGRVYEARDLDLGVRLALKTIRPEISSDPRTIDLFKHEIQLARQVTHFNVCRIFDLERHKSGASRVTFLTMELLEGETLENRLQRDGAMSPEQALPLIRQMAHGLAAIHEVSVVHRDFKPSNVLLVPSGNKTRVVITDFGLARAKAFAVVSETAGGSRMMTGLAGTPAYMAPEQLTGGEISPATDIYALGLVVSKMITGRLPSGAAIGLSIFHSKGGADPVFSAPDLRLLNAGWENGVLRCLERDPASRFKSALEFVDLLEKGNSSELAPVAISDSAAPSANQAAGDRRMPRLRLWEIAALLLVLVSIASGGYFIARVSRSGNLKDGSATENVELNRITRYAGLAWGPSLSADGNTLAYSSNRNGNRNLDIWVQDIRDNNFSREPIQITHDGSDGTRPALSPDGKMITYRSERDGGGIYIARVGGGTPWLLVRQGRDPRFSPDGKTIAYWVGDEHNIDDSFRTGGRVFVIPVQGGNPTPIEPQFADARYPSWGSDGRFLMFQGAPQRKATFAEASDWWIESMDRHQATQSGAFSVLQHEGLILYGCPYYWSGSDVVFAARKMFATSIFALRLSDDLRATNSVKRITFDTSDDIEPWVSQQGKLVLSTNIAWISIWKIPFPPEGGTLFGEPSRVTAYTVVDTLVSASRDGKKLAFHRRTGQAGDVYVKELDSGQESIVPIPGNARPILSDDGQELAYSVSKDGKTEIDVYSMSAGIIKRLCDDCGTIMAISPDHTRVLYSLSDNSIGMLDLAGGKRTQLIKMDHTILAQPRFSPDGRWVSFVATVDEEHSQINIASLAKDGTVRGWIPVTSGTTRDLRPTWSATGSTLFYLSNRDGFNCVWQLQLDPNTMLPRGTPSAVHHFHDAQISLMHLSIDAMSLTLGGRNLYLNIGDVTGNIFEADRR